MKTETEKRNDNPSQNREQRAAQKQPITLDVEVLEERIAPGFLSGFRTPWQLPQGTKTGNA